MVHWVANHRRHHIHSDTPEDPHSPYVRARHDVPRDGGHDEPRRSSSGMVRGLLHAQWGHMVTDDVFPTARCSRATWARDPGAALGQSSTTAAILWAGLLLAGGHRPGPSPAPIGAR